MAWYDTGTVNVTNGSAAVIGVGTNFIAGAQVGEGFYGPDNRLYEIQAIVSATSLTLADVYLGTTQTGQGYKIVPTQSLVAALATQVSTLISDFQGVVDEAGSGKFNDGTAASAGITFTLDQDTGIFRPAANQIGFTTAGVERVKITSTGIDVSGDAEVNGNILIDSGSATPLHVDRSSNAGAATVQVSNSTHTTYFGTRSGGGFAIDDDADLSLGPWLVIDTAGQVGIGTTTPSAILDVGGNAEINGALTVQGSTGSLFLTDTDVSATSRFFQTGSNLYASNQTTTGSTIFTTDDGKNRQRIRSNGDVSFYDTAGTTESFYWDASQLNLGLGTSSPSHRVHAPSGNIFAGSPVTSFPAVDTSGSGAGLLSAGVIAGVRDNYSLTLNRHTTTGSVAQFYYSGSFKGSISVTGSATAYNTTSDYRLKENITPVQGAADIVKAMQPVTYTFKSDGSWHDGFLAHELQELHPRAVIGEKDAMKDEEYEVTPAVYEDIIIPAVEAVAEVPAVYDDEGVLVSEMVPAVEAQPERTEQQLVSEAVMGTRSVPDYQGVDYSKLTPILTAALQEALNKIDALEARLAAANI